MPYSSSIFGITSSGFSRRSVVGSSSSFSVLPRRPSRSSPSSEGGRAGLELDDLDELEPPTASSKSDFGAT
jgi:hypothetical protein